MYKTLSLIILMLLLASAAPAQYNERDILSQQAYVLLSQRQFAESEKIFLEILAKFPDDTNSVLQLMNIYYQTSQVDKAESILNQYRRILPPNQAQEQDIQLLIMQGKPDAAWKLSQAYLKQPGSNENSYRLVASYFERRGFFEQVLQLYKDARSQLNKPELFQLEIANSALNYRLFSEALQEYLTWLEKNPANLFFVNNQCKIIINEDPSMLQELGDFVLSRDSEILKELYANILVAQKQWTQALSIYKKLPQDKLIRFADEQYSALNDELALPAFRYLESISADPFTRNDYRLRLAYIQFRNLQYAETGLLLQQVIDAPELQSGQNRLRKGINLNARKLMAENILAQRKDVASALTWYQEAKNYCVNSYDTQDIDLAIVRLLLIQKDFVAARNKLLAITDEKHAETRDYLLFTTELMQGNIPQADSLMNEYVIRYPAGTYVNDAFYQMMLVLGLQGADREGFFAANRLMLLKDSAAVDSLQSIFSRTKDEELLILAAEWAILLSDEAKAQSILDYPWEDGVCAEYAALLKLMLTSDSETEQRMARDFLKANPNSIFAPKFRQRLSRANYSRPEY